MKNTRLLLPLACLALVACSKPAEPAAEAPPAPVTTPSIAAIPAAAIAKAEAVVAEVETKSAAAMAELETTIEDVKVNATKLYTDAVAKAKTHLGEKNFALAVASLDSLKDVVLSAEQQKIVSELRTQISKAQEIYKQAQAAKNLFGK